MQTKYETGDVLFGLSYVKAAWQELIILRVEGAWMHRGGVVYQGPGPQDEEGAKPLEMHERDVFGSMTEALALRPALVDAREAVQAAEAEYARASVEVDVARGVALSELRAAFADRVRAWELRGLAAPA
jgi:hypothetical protein